MEKYIRELLQDHDRVIIPNFGGFLKSKGEINTLIFNEFIKFNDGQLINYVAKQEEISIDEASSKVDDYAEQLKSRLSEGREVKIEGVGVLYTADTGRIRFNSESGDAPEKKADKKREARVEKMQDRRPEKKEEPLEEPKKPVPVPPKPVEKKTNKPVPADSERKMPATQPEEKSKQEVPAKKDDQKTAAAIASTANDVPSEKSGRIRQPDPRKTAPPASSADKKEGTKRSPWLWVVPILIVLGLIVWAAIDYDNIRGYFYMESDEVASTEPNETVVMKNAEDENAKETMVADTDTNEGSTATSIDDGTTTTGDAETGTEAQQEQLTEANQAQQQGTTGQTTAAIPADEDKSATEIPATPPKKYHLIAGVFDEKENAVELVNKLKNEGFYAEIIGFINNKYYVSYNSFKSKTDARYEWERLRDKGNDAWLYYY